MTTWFDLLPNEINQIIEEHKAAQQIQDRVYKMFYRQYGLGWKKLVNNKDWLLRLEYYYYINGIDDPWIDYMDGIYNKGDYI